MSSDFQVEKMYRKLGHSLLLSFAVANGPFHNHHEQLLDAMHFDLNYRLFMFSTIESTLCEVIKEA